MLPCSKKLSASEQTALLINTVFIQQVRISWVYIELSCEAYSNLTKKQNSLRNQIWLIVDNKIRRLSAKPQLPHY